MTEKTTCYCIYCSKHPLYEKYKDDPNPFTGYKPSMGFAWMATHKHHAADVECLEPSSDAFDEMGIHHSELDFEITAYGDGGSITGFDAGSWVITAHCDNEDYKGEE